MAELTSAARIKRVLGIPAAITLHDTYLGELADAVDTLVLEYCGQPTLTWGSGFSDKFDVELNGMSEVMLRRFPVEEVTAVLDAGSTLSADSWYLDSRTGAVRLTGAGAAFTQGKQKVEVQYTAGHTAASPGLNTLAHAASVWATALFNAGRHAGLRSEGAGSYRYSVDTDGVPAPVRAMLSSYIRIIPRDSQP